MTEKQTFHVNGYLALVVLIGLLVGGGYLFYHGFVNESVLEIVLSILLWIVSFLFLSSLTIVQPNQAKAILFFGQYLGTIKDNGLFVTTPLTQKINVSLKVRNFNSSLLKVNDSDGNPIEISAVVVFKVVDTAKALFDVDYYQDFIEIQSETAIRHIATQYPYDTFNDDDLTLRGNTSEVSEELAKELQERLAVAGVEVIETRLNHLAYATEIASAMLQRQQAKAILSARQIIVEGAVSMTQMALEQIEDGQDINFTDDRKVQLINNLLVSIITDKGTQPVINTGDVKEKGVKHLKKLYIKQKVFSIGEKFTVTDDLQNPRYYVEGSFFKIPKSFTIFNEQQRPIAEITKKVFSLLPKFFVEVHGQEAIVLEKHFTFFKARYSISAEGIDVDGNWWDMDFVVNRNGKRIAEIHKKWISWGDTYEVVIYEEDLDDLIIALVVAIDRVKADDAAASSSASS